MAAKCLNPEECIPEGVHSFSLDKVVSFTEDSVLLRTPYPLLAILTCYLLVVLRIGPAVMANRQPYRLNTLMRLYNLCQVTINGFLILKVLARPGLFVCYFKNRCSITALENCEEHFYVYYSFTSVFMLLKVLDLADTVFMVLRKKNSHITFLHVYHHVIMAACVWIFASYTKTLHALIAGVVNTTVHAIMYGYYFLATFPRLKKYLWWKSHLTKLQLGQFFLVLMHFAYLYVNNCHVSHFFLYVLTFNVTVICLMFMNFYVKEYIVKIKGHHAKP